MLGDVEYKVYEGYFAGVNPGHLEQFKTALRDDDAEAPINLVIPAHNEGGTAFTDSNLYNTIKPLSEQVDEKGHPVDLNDATIVVVDNASSDNTAAVIDQCSIEFPGLRIVRLSESQKGVQFARRLGFDYVNYKRYIAASATTGSSIVPSYFSVSMDADNEGIDPVFYHRLQNTLLQRQGDCYGGEMRFSAEAQRLVPRAIQTLYDYVEWCRPMWQVFGMHTPGPISCFSSAAVLLSGGINTNNRASEDVNLGNRIVAMGGLSLPLPTYVVTSARKIIDAPLLFVSGKAYRNGLTDVRSGPGEVVDLTDNEEVISRQARREMVVDIQFLLQAMLKPNIVADIRNQAFFQATLGTRLYPEFMSDIMRSTQTADKSATLAMLKHKYGAVVFGNLFPGHL
jgi:glycosyltransferase involved in cell wall biosynthesis